MVEVCWLIQASKCGDQGRTCKTEKPCFYKTEEAKRLLRKLHTDLMRSQVHDHGGDNLPEKKGGKKKQPKPEEEKKEEE